MNHHQPNVEWVNFNSPNLTLEIGELYLVKVMRGGIYAVYLGIFDGEYWTIADDAEQIKCKPNDDSLILSEFSEIPKFKKEYLTEPRAYCSYLISVRLKHEKGCRIMIGTFCKDSWSVGDTKDAFDIYLSDIKSIKVHCMPLLADC